MAVAEGALLWEPSEEFRQNALLSKYMTWLKTSRKVAVSDVGSLWQWSVEHLEDFWESVWQYFDVQSDTPYESVLSSRVMPGARWFTESRLNYAAHVFRQSTSDRPAIYYRSEANPMRALSWAELEQMTAAMANYLKSVGVVPGDRVAAYIHNGPQAVASMLACASIGAIWSSCATEFGIGSALSRFQQIQPKVLIAVEGYQYNGKSYDRHSFLRDLALGLTTVEHLIVIPFGRDEPNLTQLRHAVAWDEVMQTAGNLTFESLPFDHPLWILYSSGTTGLPKPIVHGHGGILLEHLAALGLHGNVQAGDRFFWYTTTGWMMWNYTVAALLTGASIILYDGSPTYPDVNTLWRLAEQTGMTCFGTSPAYINACMKAGLVPKEQYNLSHLTTVGYTGSPLSPEGFAWLYEAVKDDLWVASVSGGTDICGIIVGSCPLSPVYAGEIQSRCFGVDVHVLNERGDKVIGKIGEMVMLSPMPSMPLYFWNDVENKRYVDSYFNVYPGIWRHGDLLKITERGSAVIYGRSDATINRGGIRSGSSEIYYVVESVPEVLDSLVVDLSGLGRADYVPLFVVLVPGTSLDDRLKSTIRGKIREQISPRHVPNEIFSVPAIPRTLSGKKLEIPVRKILLGTTLEKAVNADSVANPQSLQVFVDIAQTIAKTLI